MWPPDGTLAILKSYPLSSVVVDDEKNVLQARFWGMHLVSEFKICADIFTTVQVLKFPKHSVNARYETQQDQVSAYNLLKYLHDAERGK